MPLLSYLLGNSMDDLLSPVVPPGLRDAIVAHHHERDAMPPRMRSAPGPVRAGHLHPWRHTPVLTNFMHHPFQHARHQRVAPAHKDAHAFKVNLDVQQFRPDEITVKMVDGFIVVEAKHEERVDEHGFISREFTRRYKLPEGADEDGITSSLSSDGILCIEAPKKSADPPSKERAIPITRTHAPAVTAQPAAEPKKSETEAVNGETMDQ